MAKIKIQVTRPVAIPDNIQKRLDLKMGLNEIDEVYLNHWYVKSLIQQNVIILVTKKAKINFKSLDQIAAEKKAIEQASMPNSFKEMEKAVEDEKIIEVVAPSKVKEVKAAKPHGLTAAPKVRHKGTE